MPKPKHEPVLSPQREAILALLHDDGEVIFLEGPEFDVAILGLAERFGQPRVVCYDYAEVLAVLVRQGMDGEEAVEWFEFNVIGAWMGDATPIYLDRLTPGTSAEIHPTRVS